MTQFIDSRSSSLPWPMLSQKTDTGYILNIVTEPDAPFKAGDEVKTDLIMDNNNQPIPFNVIQVIETRKARGIWKREKRPIFQSLIISNQ